MYKGNRLHECPVCHKYFQSLGIARHRAMHYDKKRRQNVKESPQTSNNSGLMQLLRQVQKFIDSSDCPVTSESMSIYNKINAVLAQQHQTA
jgi:hypothetical protein